MRLATGLTRGPSLWITRSAVARVTARTGENVLAPAWQRGSALRSDRCARTAPCAARARNPPSGRGVAGRSRGSDRQTLAALGAARLDDSTAASRLHADQKTVRAGTADFGGLIGAFHGKSLPVAAKPRSEKKEKGRSCRPTARVCPCVCRPPAGKSAEGSRAGKALRPALCKLAAGEKGLRLLLPLETHFYRFTGNPVLEQKVPFSSTTCTPACALQRA